MSNQVPVPQTALGRVLSVTRGRSRSLGSSEGTPAPDDVQRWLREQVDAVKEPMSKLQDPPDATAQELAEVREKRRLLQQVVGKPLLASADVGAAQSGLKALADAVQRAGDAVQQRLKQELQALARRLDGLMPTPEALPEERRAVDEAHRGFAAIGEREPPLKGADVAEAARLVDGLPALVEACTQAVQKRQEQAAKDLRDGAKRLLEDPRLKEARGDEMKPLAAVPVAMEERLKTLDNQSLAAAKKLLDGLPALIGTCKQAIDKRLRARAQLVQNAVGPKSELAKDPDGALPGHAKEMKRLRDAIRTALATPELTDALVTAAEQDHKALAALHAKAKQMVADVGGAANGRKLKDAFPDAEQLEAFVAEGLGGQTKLLGSLLTDGCGGDAQKLKNFGTAFADPADRRRLQQLLGAGGLAGKPQAMGALLRVGCGGDPAQFRQLAARLTDPRDPGAETPALKNLNTVLGAGGLGDAPEVLGHLLKTGCPGKPADGPWDFEALCAEFAAAPAAMGKLLKEGGLAGSAKPPKVRADTLAQMLAVGCNGDAKQLLALAQSTAVPKVKGLLQGGGLGEQPEALAHAYRLGCNGEPARLAALHDAFENAGGSKLGRLKAMMVDGNLQQRPELLGELLGTGCSGRPDKLKDMAVSFAGRMDQLDEMVSAWGDESGAHLKALTGPRHLGDDFSKLQGLMQSLQDQVYGAADRERLLNEAPKFQRTVVVSPAALNGGLERKLKMDPAKLADFADTDCDYLMAHICERHLQTHFAFKGAQAAKTPIDHHNTQFPDDWTPQQVADLMMAALAGDDAQAKLAEIKAQIAAWVEADAKYRATLHFKAFRATYPTKTDYDQHVAAHKNWLLYNAWFNTPSPKSKTGKTKGQMWTAYDHNRDTWSGAKPEAPPVARPAHAKAHLKPPPIPPDPGDNPDPGKPPKPQRDFKHGKFEFRVGVKRQKDGKLRITQLFPLSANPPDLLKEFKEYEMKALRDGMIA